MKKTEQENMSGNITKFSPGSLSGKFSSSVVEFTVQNNKGTLVVDSRVVADMVDKEHKNLLRDIRNYESQILTNSNLSSLNFFIKSSYKDTKGEERESYLLTRKGCEFVANKMTGKKGTIFTATYIDKFHEMEQQLVSPFKIPTTMKEVLQIAIEQEEKIEQDRPHVEFSKAIIGSPTSIMVRDMAKILKQNGVNIGQNKFYEYLRNNDYVQSNKASLNLPTQKSMELGIMEIEEKIFRNSLGENEISLLTKITTKGQVYFLKKLSFIEQSYSTLNFLRRPT